MPRTIDNRPAFMNAIARVAKRLAARRQARRDARALMEARLFETLNAQPRRLDAPGLQQLLEEAFRPAVAETRAPATDEVRKTG